MFRYELNVLPEASGNPSTYEVSSPIPLNTKQLMVVGLVLDGGILADELESLWRTASLYVSVKQLQ